MPIDLCESDEEILDVEDFILGLVEASYTSVSKNRLIATPRLVEASYISVHA